MDKNSYALGMSIAHNLLQSGVKTLVVEDFTAGLKAILSGEPTALSIEEAGAALESFFAELEAEQARRQESAGKVFRKEGEDWLAANASKPGVKVLASGLQYKVITQGKGRKPKASDKVRCHYCGTLIDGTKFDGTNPESAPIRFTLDRVIKGWTEGMQLVGEGGKITLYVPSDLAYGERPMGGMIKPNSTLIFDVEVTKVGKVAEQE